MTHTTVHYPVHMDTIANIHKSSVGNIPTMKKYHNQAMNEFICHFKDLTGKPQLIGGFKPRTFLLWIDVTDFSFWSFF